MTIIAERDRLTVQNLFARELVDNVELLLFTRGRAPNIRASQADCETCEDTLELLEQITALSENIVLTVYDVGTDDGAATWYNVNAVPTVIIRKHAAGADESRHPNAPDANRATPDAAPFPRGAAGPPGTPPHDANIRFLGLPGGYEFSTLIADIVDVSRSRSDLSAATVEAIRAIDEAVHIQVFVTPGCPYCPRVARMAHQMAMQNPLVLADVIEANEFQSLSEQYRVQSVPKTVINNRIEFTGSLPEAKVVEAVQQAVSRNG
ncbi:MAG: thioredoxin family protein [Chloroflexota bacterium]